MEVVEHKHVIIRAELDKFFGPEKKGWKHYVNAFLPACWRFSVDSAPIKWCTDLVEKMGMNLLIPPQAVYLDRKGLRGWTIICVIETSHIVIHVWDEPTPVLAQFDVYTCGSLDTQVVFDHLEQFGIKRIDYLLIDREYSLAHLNAGTVVPGAV